MGAGCNYTIKANRDVKAALIELSDFVAPGPHQWDDAICDIGEYLSRLPLTEKLYYGSWYKFDLYSDYNGDMVVVDFDITLPYWDPAYPLAEYRTNEIYRKICRHLKEAYQLWFATSAYTLGKG